MLDFFSALSHYRPVIIMSFISTEPVLLCDLSQTKLKDCMKASLAVLNQTETYCQNSGILNS